MKHRLTEMEVRVRKIYEKLNRYIHAENQKQTGQIKETGKIAAPKARLEE